MLVSPLRHTLVQGFVARGTGQYAEHRLKLLGRKQRKRGNDRSPPAPLFAFNKRMHAQERGMIALRFVSPRLRK